MTTAEDICQEVPRKKLDSPITDVHIADLAFKLTTWEKLAPYLGLTEAEVEEIQVDCQGQYGLQKRQALRMWKSKLGSSPEGATYRQLIIALCHARDKEIAKEVKELLMVTSDTLETFRKYLVDCYTITQHPSQIQRPFLQLSSYIDLTLIQATDTQVQLGELFHVGIHQAKRKMVLIEGPAGCGKTTLSWHVCQEWAAGRLFQQFSLLIHISLKDQNILTAKHLADIIPHKSCATREAVAGAISEQGGQSVCFLFDGWDEASHALRRNSYVFKFITGISTAKLYQRNVIITSRPVAAGHLYPYLTVHVNIKGFETMKSKLEEFICANLKDPDDRNRLLQQLQGKPLVNDLCTLPINAAIVVHLFCSSHSTLPSTHTCIFKKLVSNLVLRHMQLRTDYELKQWQSGEFEHLPGNMLQQFKSLCHLAFHGIKSNKNEFPINFLRQLGITQLTSTLGLMKVQQYWTKHGPQPCYSFLHYAVQEFLAAYHISKFNDEEQTEAVRHIFHNSPLSTVLPFYAGLTGLSNKSACSILLGVTKHPLQHTLYIIALLNCIYEAQKPSMCNQEIEILINLIRQVPSCGQGNSRALKSLSHSLIQNSVFGLTKCLHPAVTDIKSALRYLIERVSRNTSCTFFAIDNCGLGSACAYHLALLAAVRSNIKRLNLSMNNIRSAIPFIAGVIKYNKTIEILHLRTCFISDRELLVLGEALQQNNTLKELEIIHNLFSSNALTLFLKGFIGTNSRLHTVVVSHLLSDEQRTTINTINIFRSRQSVPPLEVTDMIQN